jgi:hypothetical protein
VTTFLIIDEIMVLFDKCKHCLFLGIWIGAVIFVEDFLDLSFYAISLVRIIFVDSESILNLVAKVFDGEIFSGFNGSCNFIALYFVSMDVSVPLDSESILIAVSYCVVSYFDVGSEVIGTLKAGFLKGLHFSLHAAKSVIDSVLKALVGIGALAVFVLGQVGGLLGSKSHCGGATGNSGSGEHL